TPTAQPPWRGPALHVLEIPLLGEKRQLEGLDKTIGTPPDVPVSSAKALPSNEGARASDADISRLAITR
ncbi:MAG: hypothetical protein IJ131_10970, partial [Eggerthellaceae bacterium]|nr:hypothetical protein [Eggerthellaceae bacterium]